MRSVLSHNIIKTFVMRLIWFNIDNSGKSCNFKDSYSMNNMFSINMLVISFFVKLVNYGFKEFLCIYINYFFFKYLKSFYI